MPRRVDLEAVLEAVGTDRGADPGRSGSLDRVLDAAFRCFAEGGVGATTMSDVAEAAGLSRVWVHRLVGSKGELLHAVLTREVERALANLATDLPPDIAPIDAFMVGTGLIVSHFAAHPLVRRFIDDEADEVVAAFTDGRFLTRVAERITLMSAPVLGASSDATRPIVEAATRVAVSLIIAPMTPGGDDATAVAELMGAAFGPALRAATIR